VNDTIGGGFTGGRLWSLVGSKGRFVLLGTVWGGGEVKKKGGGIFRVKQGVGEERSRVSIKAFTRRPFSVRQC